MFDQTTNEKNSPIINGDHAQITYINNKQTISANYSVEQYAERKKSTNMKIHTFAFIIGLILDIITLFELLRTTLNTLINIVKNSHLLEAGSDNLIIKFGFLLLLWGGLSCILVNYFNKLHNLKKHGIFKSYYYSDKNIYKLIPKHCPKCKTKLYISSKEGEISFNCPRSKSHTKTIDITELDNLPLKDK